MYEIRAHSFISALKTVKEFHLNIIKSSHLACYLLVRYLK